MGQLLDDLVESKGDRVNHPLHYGGDTVYEAIKVIYAWEEEWRKRGLSGMSLGNAVKYICRTGAKGDPVQDLKKARFYLDLEIARLEQVSGAKS